MRKRLCAAILMMTLLTGTCAGAWNDNANIYMSSWAASEVQAAYDSGAVSAAFDLGTDYTRPISRGELARLMVDLIAHEQQLSITDLTAQLGISLQSVPLTPAQPAEESNEVDSSPELSGEDDSTDASVDASDVIDQTNDADTESTETPSEYIEESTEVDENGDTDGVMDANNSSEPILNGTA